MLSFLGFVFFFVLIIIFFGLTVIGGVLRALFGFGRRSSSSTRSTSSSDSESDSTTYKNKKGNAQSTPKRKKIFEEDEGEYVDFEEMK